MKTSKPLRKTTVTTLKRIPERGSYDRSLANSILDEGLIAHVGFFDGAQVFVIPMAYARVDSSIYLHGSISSRLLNQIGGGLSICLNVTILDGLVLARSVFEHSMNYRSLAVFGNATAVTDLDRKNEILRLLTEHIVPGRWVDARQPTSKELAATSLLELPLVEASVKTRSGPPTDLAKDLHFPTWAGVIPLDQVAGKGLRASDCDESIDSPDYVIAYSRTIAAES